MLRETLECAFGHFDLIRPGAHKKQPLRAWDAADEYLIDLISQRQVSTPLIILNDQFGALGCALNSLDPVWISDSFCAKQALEQNLTANHLKPLCSLNALETPNIQTDLAILKLPKNTSFLEYQLNQCFEIGVKEVLIAGMMKHLPKNLLKLLLQYGEVERLPFIKKSTVFQLTISKGQLTPYPKSNAFFDVKLLSHANVFGRDKLDPGAQFFLENIQKIPRKNKVADLCCGSGILGIRYAQLHEDASVDFYDESHMSISSTESSWSLNQLSQNAHFYWQDGLGESPSSYDLILCNPPFHEAHTVGDHISKRLFKQAKQALGQSGHLLVVGNRHLKYHVSLKHHFKHVETIAANSKFVLLEAHG